MSLAWEILTLKNEFATRFAALQPTVPIDWSGMPFNGDDFDPQTEATTAGVKIPFVQPNIVHDEAKRVSIGPDHRREYPGMFIVKVFYPMHSGFGTAMAVADSVISVLRDLRLESGTNFIQFRGGGPTAEPTQGFEGGWAQMNVWARFYRSETITAA